jgi:hypothetical protein
MVAIGKPRTEDDMAWGRRQVVIEPLGAVNAARRLDVLWEVV